MVWIDPPAWVGGIGGLTSALLNTYVRGNLKAIGDPWTAYTPVWTAATTNPVINNGTIVGAYRQTGKTVEVRVTITMGSTTTYGSGQYSISLPAAAAATPFQMIDALVVAGTTTRCWGRITSGATTTSIWAPGTTAGGPDRLVTATVPATLANTHTVVICGTYEAA